MFLAPKRWRLPILAGIIVAGIGAYQLMDPQFIDRSSTILRPEEERDRSSESRLEIWQGGYRMLIDHPLGVGAGNFYQNIGRYSPNNPGRDAHSTFVRCFAELGFPGIAVFLLLLGNVGYMVRGILKRTRESKAGEGQQLALIAYGFGLSLATLLICGLTCTFLYTEGTWWLLAVPVCMTRALENLQRDTATVPLADHRQASGTVRPANHRPAPQLESGPKPQRRP
jgi:O-antigen ligase